MKNTKKALLTSALCLLLCCSMLIGTTFAWFTDEVKSGNNIIQSGNLDIELMYSKDMADGSWKTVNGSDEVITKGALWEPGHTEVVYLKISNEGTLALKYAFNINFTDTVIGKTEDKKDIKLSEHLMYAVVDVTGKYADRDAAREAVEDVAVPLAGYAVEGVMNAGDADKIVALVIYMPETVGNEANYRGDAIPQIEMGISLFATQQMKENDSYGDEYDAAAPWTGIIPASLEETTIEIVPGGGTKTGTITINSAEDLVYLNKLAKEWVSLYTNGQGTDVEKYYVSNGGKGTDYYYHRQWTLELAADLDLRNIPMDSVDISYWGSFNGNGHTISNVVVKNGQPALFDNTVNPVKNLTVENIVVNAPGVTRVAAVSNRGALENVHVVNANVIGGKYVGGLVGQGSNFINCSIKDSVIVGTDKTVGGLVGYCSGDPGQASATGNVVENVTITGAWNVGGMFGQAQNVIVDGNTVKNATVKSTLELPADASSNEVRTAKVAARSEFAGTVIGANIVENVTLINVEHVSNAAELVAAINEGKTDIVLGAGDYTLPSVSNGDVTISGTTDTVITVDKPNYSGSDVTFNGVTIKGSGYATGVQHVDTVTYNNATIVGEMCLYGEKVVFNNCTFELNNQYIWTYGAKEVEFNNCTFNTNGKAVLIYKEAGAFSGVVTINGCTFNATASAYASAVPGQPCAAVEIDSSLINGSYTVKFIGENVVDEDFSGLVRVKKGSEKNNVFIDGATPVTLP